MNIFTRRYPRAQGTVIHGVLFLWILIYFGLLTFNTSFMRFSFLGLPLAAIYLWPRGSDPLVSTAMIAVSGLFLDFVSASPAGQWVLVFLITFGVLRPYARNAERRFIGHWIYFSAVVFIAFFLIYGLNQFAGRDGIRQIGLIQQASLAAALFPIIFLLRNIGRNLVVNPRTVRRS